MKAVFNELPEEFIEKLKALYPSVFPKICETFLHKKEQTFRINYLKASLPVLKEDLDREGIKYRELHWPKGSFILRSANKELHKSPAYIDGKIYMQNVSSMLPPMLLGPKPGEKILDLCAAPGAKTSEIASLAGREIELVAVEKLGIRYEKLLATLKIQGVDFAKTLMEDGIEMGRRYPDYFDKVLVDAPCSGEALFYMRDPKSFKPWSQKRVRDLSHTQKVLIYSGVSALKEGGELVYSTCTFSPEENEEVVDWALNKFEGLRLLPVDMPLPNKSRGIARWEGKAFSKEMGMAMRVLPNDYMEGFFMAKLRKDKK
ncbi:MAG TPA: RsmB/NOP family class I SAM-dependent RNA methyltransferase [Candidatus Omnitrophota bacterium]|nr:RsmB/NOP family class I SAM-dependent RNA methyltransferase [Candidatus Omnitrophota bacterium]HOX09214.1 RsmB/NOP family class I SAM-dependent RNA methyltransferase [Candidatus Omnitrophota bacterium]HPN66505.1 RsmB/NOP family class I SAM-dependent RNA methyltransferase [Candidatus Omnitrophota bacterium]